MPIGIGIVLAVAGLLILLAAIESYKKSVGNPLRARILFRTGVIMAVSSLIALVAIGW